MEYITIIDNVALPRIISPFLLWQSGHDAEDTKQSTADMTAFVSTLQLFSSPPWMDK